MKACEIPERFVDESLASHWKVDETEESFLRLMRHLEVDTNFKPYFEKALGHFMTRCCRLSDSRGMTVLDLGSGVSWTSAILANHEQIKHVYAVEPSRERLKHGPFVLKHFKIPGEKVTLLEGSFTDFDIPRQVNFAVLCASFHHCYDEFADILFSKIKAILAPGGLILMANEHYVDHWFSFHRFLSFIKHFPRRRELFYKLSNLRSPYPYDGEHWRTRNELEEIFERNGLKAEIFIHDGDLCKEAVPFYRKMGYHYYYAILERM